MTPVLSGQTLFTHSQSDGRLDVSTGNVLGSYQTADVPPAFGGGAGFFVASGVLHAADPTLATTHWTFSGDGSLATVPLIVGNVVYVGSSIGTLFAVDATTGAALWSDNTGAPLVFREPFTTEPRTAFAAGQGVLLVPSGEQLIAYESSAPGDGGRSPQSPGTADDR
jgi:outer membrane protein assembly factor BamB